MTKTCCSCKLEFHKRTNKDGQPVKKKYFRVPSVVSRNFVGPKLRRREVWLRRIYGIIPERLPKELWICEDHFVNGSPSHVSEVNSTDWAPSVNVSHSTTVASQLNQEDILEEALSSCEADPQPCQQIPDRLSDSSLIENQQIEVWGEIEIESEMSATLDMGSPAADSHRSVQCNSPEHDLEKDENEVFFDARDIDVGLSKSIGTQSDSVGTQTFTFRTLKDRATQTVIERKGRSVQTDVKKYRTISTQTELSMHEIDNTERHLHDAQGRLNALEISQDWYKDDNVTKYYTGLPNFTVLMAIFEVVSPFITYTPRSVLTPFQQFALTLMKLRLNLYFTDLGYRFNVSRVTAGRMFSKCVEILYCRLKRNIFWPERPLLKSTMPADFIASFGDSVTVIIDCFEIYCQKASNLTAKAETWSLYKHHQTVKYLLAVTPQGFICFVSKSYGGRCSDKFITEDCGFLNNLSPGDVIMADRGFLVEDSVGLHMAKVIMPAFTKGLSQLSPDEVESTRKIANVRIHVERVIGMLRQKYRIMSTLVPIRFLNYDDHEIGMDEIVTVCCALINMCPGIVPLD